MKTKLLLVFILALLTFSLYWLMPVWRKENLPPLPDAMVEGVSFFIPVRIVNFTSHGLPCLMVKIEDTEFQYQLDLGSNNEVTIANKLLDKIKDKSFVGTKIAAGFRGNPYEINTYKIPSLHIGNLNFHPILLVEENKLLEAETHIGKNASVKTAAGKIGWKIFEKTGLFLDFGRSMIIICDKAETLEKQGYSLKHFTKIPMHLERGLIEMSMKTANGPLDCVLDTGCTYNHFNTDNTKNEPLEKMILKKKKNPKFIMGNKDFGPIVFRKIPIQLPFQIDVLLGMEFLQEHIVFIDFIKNEIYFSKTSK